MKVNVLGYPGEVDATVEALRRWMAELEVTGRQVDRSGMLVLVSIECQPPHQWMTLPERPDGPLGRESVRLALHDAEKGSVLEQTPGGEPARRRPRRIEGGGRA